MSKKQKQKKGEVSSEVAQKAQATAPQPDWAELIKAMGGLANRPANTAPQVGIRNVCANSLGIPAFGNEPAFQLVPFSPTEPNSMAVISWPRWQLLRKNTLYDQGMIERFDEILDEGTPRGPVDKPHECAPNHEKNKIVDPHQWIESKNDTELKTAILALTSVSQLQRLLGVVDRKLKEIETAIRASGVPVENPAEAAINELPISYQLTERLVEWRLGQLSGAGTPDDILPKKSDLAAFRLLGGK